MRQGRGEEGLQIHLPVFPDKGNPKPGPLNWSPSPGHTWFEHQQPEAMSSGNCSLDPALRPLSAAAGSVKGDPEPSLRVFCYSTGHLLPPLIIPDILKPVRLFKNSAGSISPTCWQT